MQKGATEFLKTVSALFFSVSFEPLLLWIITTIHFSLREIFLIAKYSSVEHTSMLVFLPKRL